jgi:hypothetical protein
VRLSFYPSGRNGHKQSSSMWGTGPVDPGGRSQVHGWAEPQRLRGGCDGNATSGRTGPGRAGRSRLVQAGPPQPPRQGRPILEDRVSGALLGVARRAHLGDGLLAALTPVAPCRRWLQSHLVCRRNIPAPDYTLPLLLLAPPVRRAVVRELAVFAWAPEWQSETPGLAASDACSLSCRR